MTIIVSYKDLVAWQKAMDVIVSTYKTTSKLPMEEKYGLAAQMRRSAVSIASNIVEGKHRNSSKEFIQFLYIAFASGKELATQFEICRRLDFINSEEASCAEIDITEACKIISGLIRSIKT